MLNENAESRWPCLGPARGGHLVSCTVKYNDSCEFLRVSSLYRTKFPHTFCLLRIIILPHGITVSHCLVSKNLKMCILSLLVVSNKIGNPILVIPSCPKSEI